MCIDLQTQRLSWPAVSEAIAISHLSYTFTDYKKKQKLQKQILLLPNYLWLYHNDVFSFL